MQIAGQQFQSKKDFAAYAASENMSRDGLQAIYNDIHGAPQMKRLRNRPTAIDRIWEEAGKRQPESVTPPMDKRTADSPESKKELICRLMRAACTLDDLIDVTGWQRHTLRGYISTLKSKGLSISSTRENGVTKYSTAA